jgi:hypothetical protein
LTLITLIADDYAITAGVSRSILRLLEHGRISGTGVMTNRPHWKGWSHALRGFHGKADLGVHLNLTLGAPLTNMPLFATSGRFPAVIEDAVRLSTLVVREDSPLKIVPIPHLIALKLYAGGHKSKADIIELLARNPDLELDDVRSVCARYRLGGLEELIVESRSV